MSNNNSDNNRENNNSIYITKTSPTNIDDDSITKVIITNNKVELITVKNSISNINNYVKLPGNMSINLSTGKCINHRPPRSRKDNKASILRSCNSLRLITDCNFSGKPNEKHIVLTYAEPAVYTQVNNDFKKFISRFRYKYGYSRVHQSNRTAG